MSITITPRLGIHRWSNDSDNQNRAQFDADNGQLEAVTAVWLPPGLLSDRPPADPSGQGRQLYTSTDFPFAGAVFYDDGTGDDWKLLNPQTTTKGDLLAAGSDGVLKRLAAGADGSVLLSKPANPLGLGWSHNLIGVTLDGTSELAGVAGSDFADLYAALTDPWDAWSPEFDGPAGYDTNASAWRLVGKILHLRLSAVIRGVGSGPYSIKVPGNLHVVDEQWASGFLTIAALYAAPIAVHAVDQAITLVNANGNLVAAANATNNSTLGFTATFEVE